MQCHDLIGSRRLHRRACGGDKAAAAVGLRLGHIPAGSTDAVAYSLSGTRSQQTAALHIALGDRQALNPKPYTQPQRESRILNREMPNCQRLNLASKDQRVGVLRAVLRSSCAHVQWDVVHGRRGSGVNLRVLPTLEWRCGAQDTKTYNMASHEPLSTAAHEHLFTASHEPLITTAHGSLFTGAH